MNHLPMKHVVVINVGPVQGFIAAARKTRDLWFGSWLLSELSKRAARFVVESGGEIISPAGLGAGGMMVNRITAVVDDAGLEKVQTGLRSALVERINKEWTAATRAIGAATLDPTVDALAQLEDLPECVWASAAMEGRSYRDARAEAEQLLAARKATRDFAPVTWGRPKAKSSLDGVRESVIPEGDYPQAREESMERQRKAEKLYRDFKAGPAERLSAVDLLKRHGGGDHPVASTSHMAALPLVQRMEQEAERVQPEVDKLLEALKAQRVDLQSLAGTVQAHGVVNHHDASFLFESRLTEDSLGRPLTAEESSKAKQALREFFRALNAQSMGQSMGWSTPLSYTLLVADGDNMGIVVDAQATQEEHKALSQALSAFAQRAAAIVESKEHRGLLIYAGGDDVMALLPVHTALACASRLNREFRQMLQAFTATGAQGDAVQPTLSVGIVIAHHLEPLADVLRLGRVTEAAAKKVDGKDALAVMLSRRSGADRTIAGRWLDGIAQRLADFANLHLRDALPHGVAYELQDLYLRLHVREAAARPELAGLSDFMRGEAVRILGRKMAQQGTRPLDETALEPLLEGLEGDRSGEQIALELIIGAELARACAAAGAPTLPKLAPLPSADAAAVTLDTGEEEASHG